LKLSVIIVNYNVKYFLEQCLFSVLKASRNIETEVFVVDNNSSDGSREYLEPRFPQVNFTWNESNAGFAKANNQALAHAKGDFILFLNPDTILPEDCFEKSIAFLDENKDVGALGVHMIDGSGKFLKESKRAFPSPATSFYKLAGLAQLFPRSRTFARYYLGNLSEKEDHEIDVLAGAYMMMTREALDKTGGFDERFFMYGEDVDLSYRIQKAGFKNFYFAGTTIIHFKGESTQKGSLNYVRLFYKAMSLFVKKHYPGGRARFYNFFIQTAIWFRAIISALGSIFRHINSTHPAEVVQQTAVVSNPEDFSFVSGLLQKKGLPEKYLHWVNSETLAKEGPGQLSEALSRNDIREVIFCGGEPGFKEIISIIQELPGELSNKFHASGSSSIVGSNSKNCGGDYIADENNLVKPSSQSV